jgi:hypothetical protein
MEPRSAASIRSVVMSLIYLFGRATRNRRSMEASNASSRLTNAAPSTRRAEDTVLRFWNEEVLNKFDLNQELAEWRASLIVAERASGLTIMFT